MVSVVSVMNFEHCLPVCLRWLMGQWEEKAREKKRADLSVCIAGVGAHLVASHLTASLSANTFSSSVVCDFYFSLLCYFITRGRVYFISNHEVCCSITVICICTLAVWLIANVLASSSLVIIINFWTVTFSLNDGKRSCGFCYKAWQLGLLVCSKVTLFAWKITNVLIKI